MFDFTKSSEDSPKRRVIKTTRETRGMHRPFKGKMLAEPKGSLKKFANRKYFSGSRSSGCLFMPRNSCYP